jgi:hypothetical protein
MSEAVVIKGWKRVRASDHGMSFCARYAELWRKLSAKAMNKTFEAKHL